MLLRQFSTGPPPVPPEPFDADVLEEVAPPPWLPVLLADDEELPPPPTLLELTLPVGSSSLKV
jgi:hypothetical protein